MLLPEKYPQVITAEQLQDWIAQLRERLGMLSEYVLSYSITTFQNLLTFLVYIILIPIMVLIEIPCLIVSSEKSHKHN